MKSSLGLIIVILCSSIGFKLIGDPKIFFGLLIIIIGFIAFIELNKGD